MKGWMRSFFASDLCDVHRGCSKVENGVKWMSYIIGLSLLLSLPKGVMFDLATEMKTPQMLGVRTGAAAS